jgi:PAS domain S-box-containing protein
MTRSPTSRLWHETVHFLLGLVALAALTGLCFWLGFRLVSAAFTYLILILLLSLASSVIAPIVLSFIAVVCLNYFFAPPIFSFHVEYQEDIITLAAFLTTSLIVTALVRRVRAARNELADVVDGIPALVWNTSPEGSADFSNQRFRDYTGFSAQDVRGWGWTNALHPEDCRVEEWRAALAAGKPFDSEARVRSSNGEYRWFLLRMVPLRNERGTIVKWYGTASDVEERKRAEQRLLDAQIQLTHVNRVATVGQLTASIAHEVNQPVAALVTNAQAALRMLSAEPPDLNQARDALGDIIKDGRRVNDVINRIRALVKKAPAQADLWEINEVIIETIAMARSEILRNGISLETQLARNLPPIRGDRVQLQQVIMNLVMNAVEAMSSLDEGTRELQIATDKDRGGHVSITVSDSGPILEPKSLNRFFEAFYSTKPTGMGIGLSICRSIIEAHEGRIWATANVPRGAALHITLPASSKTPSL